MDRKAVESWLFAAFSVVGISRPPLHLISHYTDMIITQSLSYEQVQNELIMLTGNSQQPQYPFSTTALPSVVTEPSAPLQSQFPPSNQPPKELTKEKAKEYIDELYKKFVGRVGDPASTNFLVNSLMDRSYTFQQAEYFVKFSKEAKEHTKKIQTEKEKQHQQQVVEFVKELYRVFVQNNHPTDDEIVFYAKPILDGKMTLNDVEEEFKLKQFEVLDKNKKK